MARDISEGRRAAFYMGTVLQVVGGLLFFSVFVTAAMHFGDFRDFDSNAKSEFIRALAGMALTMIGGIIRGIGEKGLAGSGVVLSPTQAGEDLEPYSRQSGRMLKDVLQEAKVNLTSGTQPEKIILIKCRSCATLNAEDSNFCKECGTAL